MEEYPADSLPLSGTPSSPRSEQVEEEKLQIVLGQDVIIIKHQPPVV